MTEIPGSAPFNPLDRKLYEEEYKHGLDLFQRALAEYGTAEEIHKKAAFKEVMDKALQVLNDTARGLRRQDLLEKNHQIAQDYQSYQNGMNPNAKDQLAKDLNEAKKSIG